MKKAFLGWATAVLTAGAVYGQGYINFNTRFPVGQVDMPVFLGNAGGARPGPEYSAALYLVSGGSLTLLPDSVTTFRSPVAASGLIVPQLASYVLPTMPKVPGITADTAVTLRIRAWATAAGSYDAAPPSVRGESADMQITVYSQNTTPPADLPPNLPGFLIGEGQEFFGMSSHGIGGYPKDFVITPEPATWALIAAGCFLFFGIRRKNSQ